MSTKRATWAAFALAGVVLLLAGPAAAVNVTPANRLGVLAACQEQQLLDLLRSQGHDTATALGVLARAVIIDPGAGGGRRIVRIGEEEPGELLPDFATVVAGDNIQSLGLETLGGDGSYEGPMELFHIDGATVGIVRGQRSQRQPLLLELEVKLTVVDLATLQACLDPCYDQLREDVATCAFEPDPLACMEAAFERFQQCTERCRGLVVEG